MEVEIIQKDIDEGLKHKNKFKPRYCSCPVWQGLNRLFPNVNVETFTCTAIIDGIYYSYNEIGIQFVEDFDCERPIEPCKITLTRLELDT